jgi:nicotinic acid mononucleotide adenylyltransferase
VGIAEHYCDARAVTTARDALRSLSGWHTNLCFLLLSGSFNPIHRGHLRVLEVARQHVIDLGWGVIGAFIAPSTDTYVKQKLGPQALPLLDRIELCLLSTSRHDWIEVCRHGEMYGPRACAGITKELGAGCFDLLHGRQIRGVEVMGSDTLRRIFKRLLREGEEATDYSDTLCCVQRGPLGEEEQRHEAFLRSTADRFKINLTLAHSTSDPPELINVSSTSIRDLMARSQWEQLASTKWLAPLALQALQSWAAKK